MRGRSRPNAGRVSMVRRATTCSSPAIINPSSGTGSSRPTPAPAPSACTFPAGVASFRRGVRWSMASGTTTPRRSGSTGYASGSTVSSCWTARCRPRRSVRPRRRSSWRSVGSSMVRLVVTASSTMCGSPAAKPPRFVPRGRARAGSRLWDYGLLRSLSPPLRSRLTSARPSRRCIPRRRVSGRLSSIATASTISTRSRRRLFAARPRRCCRSIRVWMADSMVTRVIRTTR